MHATIASTSDQVPNDHSTSTEAPSSMPIAAQGTLLRDDLHLQVPESGQHVSTTSGTEAVMTAFPPTLRTTPPTDPPVTGLGTEPPLPTTSTVTDGVPDPLHFNSMWTDPISIDFSQLSNLDIQCLVSVFEAAADPNYFPEYQLPIATIPAAPDLSSATSIPAPSSTTSVPAMSAACTPAGPSMMCAPNLSMKSIPAVPRATSVPADWSVTSTSDYSAPLTGESGTAGSSVLPRMPVASRPESRILRSRTQQCGQPRSMLTSTHQWPATLPTSLPSKHQLLPPTIMLVFCGPVCVNAHLKVLRKPCHHQPSGIAILPPFRLLLLLLLAPGQWDDGLRPHVPQMRIGSRQVPRRVHGPKRQLRR